MAAVNRSSYILTQGGYIKEPLKTVNAEKEKIRLYRLPNLEQKTLDAAKQAIKDARYKKERDYEGKINKFYEDAKTHPYLLREGSTLKLLSQEEADAVLEKYGISGRKAEEVSASAFSLLEKHHTQIVHHPDNLFNHLEQLLIAYRQLVDKAQGGTITMDEILLFQDQLTQFAPLVKSREQHTYDQLVENARVILVSILESCLTTKSSSLKGDSHLYLTFQHKEQAYVVKHTLGDGACALHALLGEETEGVIQFQGPEGELTKRYYTNALETQLKAKNPTIEACFVDALTGYFTVKGDRCGDMLFKDSVEGKKLKRQWDQLDSDYTKRIDAAKVAEGRHWLPHVYKGSPLLEEIMRYVQRKTEENANESPWYHKSAEEVMAMVSSQPQLLSNLISSEPIKYLAILKDASQRAPIQTLIDERRALNQQMEQDKRHLILSPPAINHYVAIANKAPFYLNTSEIRLAAHLFNKKVQVVASRPSGIEPSEFLMNEEAPGDLIVIHHQGAHFSRCVRRQDLAAKKPLPMASPAISLLDQQISHLLDNQLDTHSKDLIARSLFEKAEKGVLFSETQLKQLGTYFKNPKASNKTRSSVATILGEAARKTNSLPPEVVEGLEYCIKDPNADDFAKEGARDALKIIQPNKSGGKTESARGYMQRNQEPSVSSISTTKIDFQDRVDIGKDMRIGEGAGTVIINRVDSNAAQPLSEKDFIEALRESYRQKDTIPLLMGEKLSIASHYTALAIITDQEKKKTDELKKPDPRPTTYETIFQPKEPIRLKEIFERKELKEALEKRVLIQGSAGIGKSTLCQRIAYQWTSGKLWPQFKAVFWIKFRDLNSTNFPPRFGGYTVYEAVAERCGYEIEQIRGLLEQEGFRKECLLILDGYDELSHRALELKTSKNQPFPVLQAFQKEFPHIILTTRPQKVRDFQRSAELEILGFEDKGIKSYIHKFFPNDKQEEKASLIDQLNNNLLVHSLCHIPIHLEIFCFLAYEKKMFSKDEALDHAAIYSKLNSFLIERFDKNQLGGKLSQDSNSPNAVNTIDCIELVLENIAWKMMKEDTLFIPQHHIQEVLRLFKETPIQNIDVRQIGLLRTKEEGEFIHQTFQDFYAAKYLARLFKDKKIQEAREILREKKFHPRYQLALSMLAGLLANGEDQSSFQEFFNILYAPPRDLGESREFILLAELFNECGPNAKRIGQYKSFVQKVSEILKNPIISKKVKVNLLTRNHHLLAQQEILEAISQNIYLFRHIITEISSRGTFIPRGIIDYLNGIIQSPQTDSNVKFAAAKTLEEVAKRGVPLSPEISNVLNAVLRDSQSSSYYKKSVDKTLEEVAVRKVALSPENFKTFNAVLRDPQADSSAKFTATDTLRQVVIRGMPLPAEAVEGLSAVLRDPKVDSDAKRAAAYTLGEVAKRGTPLSPEVPKDLSDVLRDLQVDSYAKRAAAYALGQVVKSETFLASEALNMLSAVLRQDSKPSSYAKFAVIKALGEVAKGEAPLAPEALNLLIAFLRDPQADNYDKSIAAKTLVEIAKRGKLLPSEAFNVSSAFFRDVKDEYDKNAAVYALLEIAKRGEPLPSDALNVLINFLQDPKVDRYDERNAIFALEQEVLRKGGASLPPKVVKGLIALLHNPLTTDHLAKQVAARGLGKVAKGETALAPEAFNALITFLRNPKANSYYKKSAMHALGNVAQGGTLLASKALNVLINSLRDPQAYPYAKMDAASALISVAEGGVSLPPEALNLLIAILQDPQADRDIKFLAAKALENVAKGTTSLFKEILIKLFSEPQSDCQLNLDACLKSFEIQKDEDIKALSNICKLYEWAFYEINERYYVADQREVYEISDCRTEEGYNCMLM